MEISLGVLIFLLTLAIIGTASFSYVFIRYIIPKIITKYNDVHTKKKETKEKLLELNKKFGTLMEEKLELSVKLKRLEERIVTNAKNKIKKYKNKNR
jgi:23S rRNA maturation mini-RNase III